MYLDQQAVNQEEEAIREDMRQMSDEQRAEIFRIFKSKLKDPDTYAALNWSLVAGLHHLYLGNWVRAIVEVLVFALGVILVINDFLFGSIFIAATVLLELYELFRSQVIIQDHNNKLMREILDRHQ